MRALALQPDSATVWALAALVTMDLRGQEAGLVVLQGAVQRFPDHPVCV